MVRPQAEKDKFTAFVVARVPPPGDWEQMGSVWQTVDNYHFLVSLENTEMAFANSFLEKMTRSN